MDCTKDMPSFLPPSEPLPVTKRAQQFPYRALKHEKVLGRGAFGRVTLCSLEDKKHKRQRVAVKEIPDPEQHESGMDIGQIDRSKCFLNREKLEMEMKCLQEASGHPNICPYKGFAFGEERDSSFLVMAYAEGGNLSNMLDTHGPLEEKVMVQFALEICKALQHIHSLEPVLLHLDVKPQNILLKEKCKGPIWLCDFGLSRLLWELTVEGITHYTATQTQGGTPRYMAPELFHSDKKILSPEADIYAAGLVLLDMLLGMGGQAHQKEIAKDCLDNRKIAFCKRDKETGRSCPPVELKWNDRVKSYLELALEMTQRRRRKRPSLKVVISKLEELWKHMV